MIEEWLTGKSVNLKLMDNLVWSDYNKNKITGIYKITNKQTGKHYIGQSVNVLKRIKEHIYYGSQGKQSTVLYQTMYKYGVDQFEVKLLATCKEEKLDLYEQCYINFYRAYDKGYNMTLGGEHNPSKNPEIVRKRTKRLLYDDEVNQKLRLVGEENPRSILTEEDVISIRKRYSNGESMPKIYQDYGWVKKETFKRALYGLSWKHLKQVTRRQKVNHLTREEVLLIRKGYMEGKTVKELSVEYKANYESVRRIVKLERWKDKDSIPEKYSYS